jgi:hypothetical protein
MDRDGHLSCCWLPERILVPVGEGKDLIDLAPYLRNDAHPHAALMRQRKRLEFPTDVYPPKWEERHKIETAIIQSAAEQQIFLVKASIKAPKNYSHPVIHLKCEFGRSYQARKGADEFQTNAYCDKTNIGEPYYKAGIKNDNIVRKSDSARANGKRQAKRTATSKPPPDETCPFGIRIVLQQGRCWYIPA